MPRNILGRLNYVQLAEAVPTNILGKIYCVLIFVDDGSDEQTLMSIADLLLELKLTWKRQ